MHNFAKILADYERRLLTGSSELTIPKSENLASATGTCTYTTATSTDLQYAFCEVTKLQNAGLPMVRSRTDKNVFSRIRGTVEKGSGQLFITSSSSHFFNETNFE